jgi:mono/diheme cytochrome c family protein
MRSGSRSARGRAGVATALAPGPGIAALVLLAETVASAYPGGTPRFQTDVAPYCAACHSSRSADALADAGEHAQEELAEHKHIAAILAGQGGYASLSQPDREALATQVRALDAASTAVLYAPETVAPGSLFEVAVELSGGGGPVVAVGLVDRDHRWWARPAASAGWQVAAPPAVTGPDSALQTGWLERRPGSADRNVSFVNVLDVASDPARERFARARVVFTLRAPDREGSYPLAAAYYYGTEKSTVLGHTTDAQGHKQVRGGFDGGSGRVLFTPVRRIRVRAPDAAPAAAAQP